jgi:hypothetical protein
LEKLCYKIKKSVLINSIVAEISGKGYTGIAVVSGKGKCILIAAESPKAGGPNLLWPRGWEAHPGNS